MMVNKKEKQKQGRKRKRGLCLLLVMGILFTAFQAVMAGNQAEAASSSPVTIQRDARLPKKGEETPLGQAGVSFRLWRLPSSTEKYPDLAGAVGSSRYEETLNELDSRSEEELNQAYPDPVDTEPTDGQGTLTITLAHGVYYAREKENDLNNKAVPFLFTVPLLGPEGENQIRPKIRLGEEPPILLVEKVDEKGQPLQGVGFELHEADPREEGKAGAAVLFSQKAEGDYQRDPEGEVKEVFTDKEGVIRLRNLPADRRYLLVETKPLAGYMAEEASRVVELTAEPITRIHIVNRLGGGYHFFKYDAKSRKGVAGAVFRVLKLSEDGKSWLNPDGSQAQDKNDPSMLQLTSDSGGRFAVTGLPYEKEGTTYYLYESQTPANYEADRKKAYPFKVTADSYQASEKEKGGTFPLISIPNREKPGTPPTNNPLPPRTGDRGLTPYLLVMLAAILILAGLSRQKKKKAR